MESAVTNQHTLHWGMCTPENPHWCNFRTLQLSGLDNLVGVYIIWLEVDPLEVVYVGQGNISERIAEHRRNEHIKQVMDEIDAALRVTWAEVPKAMLNGIERYLGELLEPLVSKEFPKEDHPIRVNLPF